MGCSGAGMRRALLLLAGLLAAAAAAAGQASACPPRCSCAAGRLACAGAQLAVPPPLPPDTIALDLSANALSAAALGDALAGLRALKDLNLSRNPLGASDAVGAEAPSALGGPALQRLWLDGCALTALPHNTALAPLHNLHLLSVADNELTALGEGDLPPMPELHTLVLRRNRISALHERAFVNTPALRVLRLEGNRLSELPAALRLLPALEDLCVAHNAIQRAPAVALSLPRLSRLDARANPLAELHARALDRLPSLQVLLLSECRLLRALPLVEGSVALRVLRADRARLDRLPEGLCARAPQLRVLDLKLNQFTRLPDLHECSELRVLDLSSNRIASLVEDEEAAEVELEAGGAGDGGAGAGGGSLRGLRRLQDLLLGGNRLRRVPRTAFVHTPKLQVLNLEGNQIEHIDMEAFVPIAKLEDLNVGENELGALPAGGLSRLRHLKAHNNPRLRRVPPPAALPRVATLVLSYAYHCCEWLEEPSDEGTDGSSAEESGGGLSDLVLVPRGRVDAAAWANATDVWPAYLNASARLAALGRRRVQCAPAPGPFLPCVDLFDWWTLRCGVWAVFLLALLGNGTVVFVLLWTRARLDVPRFLVTNLACADLCMGCYLGLLAVVDAGTLGEFRAHAVAWQLSGACRLAGFLAVLSTELSVFTLAVITLERNYAITHAMHLNKRLSLRHAMGVMGAGWVLAVAAAALPLLGVSDYRKFAVCLPFETGAPAALGYVLGLLAANGLAFAVLLGCYLKMYCAIRGSQAWNSNDSRIAKRMALLVFTDFLCWAPVALCALAAALGAPLVSLEQAKVLTVFVLPLNSCCNPFLYAILTKQFKKDCALVCKAIEESRVTRGIGRCRHSSNFSNRQTPANTNSLAERSSRGGAGAGGAGGAGGCACRALLPGATGVGGAGGAAVPLAGRRRLLRWLRGVRGGQAPPLPPPQPAPAARSGRAGSVSSSVEYSSSRSDSWRAYGPPGGARGGAGGPPARRAAPWLVARKTSQDSNLSSSRNDSSGSNATASTGTWRTSRSAGAGTACSAAPLSAAGPGCTGSSTSTGSQHRPRLTRQPAVQAEEPPASPAQAPALAPRLRTIPSATETDAPDAPLYNPT